MDHFGTCVWERGLHAMGGNTWRRFRRGVDAWAYACASPFILLLLLANLDKAVGVNGTHLSAEGASKHACSFQEGSGSR